MRTLFYSALLATIFLVGAPSLSAQSDSGSVDTSSSALSKVTYPVAELGNCSSREACKLYCDKEANRDACFTYAQKVGLMTKGNVKAAVAVLSKKGPGGCSGKDECVAYCSDSSHQSECLTFAKTYQLVSEEKMNIINKFSNGEAPGACKSAQTCQMYCTDPAHRDECRSFAESNGLAPKVASSTRAQMVQGVLASTTPGRERGMELKATNQGSSTTSPGIMKKDPRMGSSTPGMKGEPTRMGSTTMPREQMQNQQGQPGMNPASGANRPPTTPTKPPQPQNENLGASVWHGFLRLIGF